MATLNQALKTQSLAAPDARLPVVLTSSKSLSELQAAGLSREVKPIPGLNGIYKATLTGRQLLELERHPDIDAIEADDEMVALGED